MIKKKKVKRRINYQKIFCFISFIFILGCIFWYGGRLVYFYQDSKKSTTQNAVTFASTIKNQNYETEALKQVDENYYFYGNVTNNYISYSNLLWRIVKINEDDSIVLITDSVIGTLAYGDKEQEYTNSNLHKWLNKSDEETSGIMERILNEKDKYLIKNSTCIDSIDDIQNVTCNKEYNDSYLGLLSLEDYIQTGGNSGFINNGYHSYLVNKNSNNEIWYLNNDGKLATSDGNEILGIKTTITLAPTTELKSGTGTIEDPYLIEETTGIIGSYVKLGNDNWRIYKENDGIVKLILQDTISDLNSDSADKLKYAYSKKNYYHNDKNYGSLAYYLNNTYYNSLSYKDLIVSNTYENGFYSKDKGYQYQDIFSKAIETKVAIPSIGDIILTDTLNGYFTATGTDEDSVFIYMRNEKGSIASKRVIAEAYIVPCISIERDKLIAGNGSQDDPYRTE